MAATKTKKVELPKITKKWYDFKIDPKTLRTLEFYWNLVSGTKYVRVYDSPSKSKQDILPMGLGRWINSYYFVLDKENKRIFAYPIHLNNNTTRSGCSEAYWSKLDCNCFYMFDENKQIWEIPYKEYRKCLGYDYTNHQYRYEMVKPEPRKVSRFSTYYYKVQSQLPSHIRSVFSYLYGKDFIYQNKFVTDEDIRAVNWTWNSWLNTKGRKYSEKTIKATNELMEKFSSESRITNDIDMKLSSYYVGVTLETINDVTAVCYWSKGRETFRQIFNPKTGKFENFIWKNDKWSKSGKLSEWQNIHTIQICDTYKKTHEYDSKYFDEAIEWFRNNEGRRGYWYSPEKNLYEFVINYISKPVIHQILQIDSESGRHNLYKALGDISSVYWKIPNRGKTMYAKLGINKYQFDNPNVIRYVKMLLRLNNIAHIDNQTWDACTNTFFNLKEPSWQDIEIINFLKDNGEFSLDRWMKIIKLATQEKNKTDQYSVYRTDTIRQLYKDYYKSLTSMKEFGIDISSYPLLFNDKQQLQRYHDEASRAVSSVKNRAADEKFAMLYEKRLKMLADDGKHMITMPKCSSDLTQEGSYLHHCVGGYVNSVANGDTAIYFLRQSNAPDTPWLTVEVRNKQCQQIHGACNAWMGSKDEYFAAVPFLVWWFKNHDIECSDHLLTCMATGYSGYNSPSRSMPVDAINAYAERHGKVKKSKAS